MTDRLRIVSNGTGNTTHLYLGDKRVTNVTDVDIHISANGYASATLTVVNVELSVDEIEAGNVVARCARHAEDVNVAPGSATPS